MVEGGMKCIKYTIFVFNFLFFISGITLIAVGGVAHAKFVKYETALEDNYYSPAVLLIVAGVFIALISFFGCFGALKEVHCLVMTYAVLLGLILILELSAGIAGYVLRNDVDNYLEDGMFKQMSSKAYINDTNISEQWHVMQIDLDCCGAKGPEDWKNSSWGNLPTNKDSVPESCCIEDKKDCGNQFFQKHSDPKEWSKFIHTEGCYKALKHEIGANIAAVGGVGVGFAFLQLVGIIFSCCLARALRAQYETV